MITLHVFNPEHDLALAANMPNFTSPHAGRQLRSDLCYLPAIWAAEGDYVLVDCADEAHKAFCRLMHRQFQGFVEKRQLARLKIDRVQPWGWDLALLDSLTRYGVPQEACALRSDIAHIRDLSHRKHGARLLSQLQQEGTIGLAVLTDQMSEIAGMLARYGKVVVKAPWSGSGRGIRFVEKTLIDYQERWIRNVIARQDAVMVEPYYNKVRDFAMEFESDGNGQVSYCGLSLFHTSNGTYKGNVLASEDVKREILGGYLPEHLLESVSENICHLLGAKFQGRYHGPFGVDMMIVAHPKNMGFLLHPCLEINLRRTMGHVALQFKQEGVMQIEYIDNHYKLKIQKQ